MKRTLISFLFILLIAHFVDSQTIHIADTNIIKKWSVSVNIGARIGGFSSNLEEEMIKQGFGDDSNPTWFGDGREYPFSKNYPSVCINAKYYFSDPFAIGLNAGFTPLGEVHGNKNDSRLTLSSTVISLGTLVSINVYDIFKIGVGPALYITNTFSGELLDGGAEKFRKVKLGILIDSGLRFPKSSRVFFEFSFQVRLAGKSEVGPFTPDSYYNETFYKTSINYTHGFVGAGVGFRL